MARSLSWLAPLFFREGAMAIEQHRLLAWVWQATATDRRLGFVEMTKAEYDAAKTEGRAQDPRVGSLHMKKISNTIFQPVESPPPELSPAMRRRRPPQAAGEA